MSGGCHSHPCQIAPGLTSCCSFSRRCTRSRQGQCCPCPAIYCTPCRLRTCARQLQHVLMGGLGDPTVLTVAHSALHTSASMAMPQLAPQGGAEDGVQPRVGAACLWGSGHRSGSLRGLSDQGFGKTLGTQDSWHFQSVLALVSESPPCLCCNPHMSLHPISTLTLSPLLWLCIRIVHQLGVIDPGRCRGWMASTSLMPCHHRGSRGGISCL